MIAAGLITAGVGVVGSTIAGAVGAKKRQGAAQTQQQRAIDAAKMNPREIQEYENTLRENERVIAREEKLINAIDPTLMEASKQAMDLLQGKEAAILGPQRRERARQREQLEEGLRRRFGPDYATSSAGIEALSRFDTETSDLLTQTQTGLALQLLGSAQRTGEIARTFQGQALGQTAAARAGISQAFSNAAARKTAAITGTAPQVVEAAGGVADAFASGFAGLGSIGGTMTGLGSDGGGFKFGKTTSETTKSTSSGDYSFKTGTPTYKYS